MKIYVGNLNYAIEEDELKQEFSQHGEVASVKIMKDRFTGKGRGFGFVEMPNDDEASAAINELNGKEVRGRSLKVNKANPPQNRSY